MVRFTVLTCVFGIAAFCLAVINHSSISYAQTKTCPCWRSLDGGLEAPAALGPPETREALDQCDTTPDIYTDAHGTTVRISATIAGVDVPGQYQQYVDALVEHLNHQVNGHTTNAYCILNTRSWRLQHPRDVSDAQACLHDILAYCRDYCMYNPNAQCQ